MHPDESSIEDVLDPGQVIIDAHHHLWQTASWRYLYPDILRDLATGHDVRATIYVEGGSLTRVRGAGGTMYREDGPEEEAPLGETEFANGVAAMAASGIFGRTRVAAGIVAFADLRLGERIRPVLEQHARCERVKGVRYIAGWNDDPQLRNPNMRLQPQLLLDPDFQRGMAVVGELGLSFETTILHYQLKELASAARALPHLQIVVCHLGGPFRIGPYEGRPKEAFDEWLGELRKLAACPNVHLKVGGLPQAHAALLPDKTLSVAAIAGMWRDHIVAAVDAFGPARCMFESNAPVDTRQVSYGKLWNVYKTVARAYTPDERDDLFFRSAARFYRLRLPHLAQGT